jgi:predicted TIM-barrel fold metal-dependent hydrolase
MGSYRLISSDSHVIEPADLWQTRIDAKYRNLAPYLAHEEKTDQWYAEGNVKYGIIGASMQAGERFENPRNITFEGRYSDGPLGGQDPHAHVKDMDSDGVSGGVLYPTMGLFFLSIQDSGLLSAICRAYNDWLAEFCAPYRNRLKGMAMLNIDNVGDGVAELRRCAKLGLAGAMIPIRPLLNRYDHPIYEPLWAAAQDLDMPLSFHTGTLRWQKTDGPVDPLRSDPIQMATNDQHLRNSLAAIILSGVFERFPKLIVGAAEFEICWAPYLIRRLDNIYSERAAGLRGHRYKGSVLPSDFFRSNTFISFQEDNIGIQLRSFIGVDNLMWGSDYPHAESTFPRSREIVDRLLDGVPQEEKAKIAGANTARVFHCE